MSKMLKLILLAMLLLIASSLIFWKAFKKEEIHTIPAALTAEELLKYTIELEEISTNLNGIGYAQVKFQLQADSVKAKDELQYRQMQIRHIIIRTLSTKSIDELKGEKGIASLEESVRNQINDMMESGHVLKIFATKLLVQD